MLSKIFISAPISLDWGTVTRFRDLLRSEGNFKVTYWERGTRYSSHDLDHSDAVVFVLPKLKFNSSHSELPIGLKTELASAYAGGKEIFIGYQTSDGSYNIYKADTDGKWIKGIAGTANSIFKKSKIEYVVKEFFGLDYEDLRPTPAKKIATNSVYGSNPCGEITLPKAKKVVATTIANPDFVDERLLLMM
jgi:hypothetical protein